MAREQDKNAADSASLEQLRNDPKLRMFLRQAGAIIAMERGLSKQSRAKLQSLAIRLELSDDQFHDAIEQLQGTGQLPKALNHWERSFLVFLKREFAGLRGRVLSISAENRAIDLAARKYQISEVRAHQLIHKSASELGVGRMDVDDAELFGQRLIVDKLGDQCSLETVQLDELYRIGDRWGLSQEAVIQLVDQTIADNSNVLTSRRSRRWLLLIPSGCAVVGLLLVLVWQNDWLPGQRKTQGDGNGRQTYLATPLNQKVDWWNEELDDAVKAIQSRQIDSIKNSLQSADPQIRLTALGRLIELAQEAPPVHRFPLGQRLWLNHLISLLYFYDTDPAVTDRVLQSLNNSLQGDTATTPRQIDSVYWAIQLLGSLVTVDTTGGISRFPGRMEPVQDVAIGAFGPFPDDSTAQEFSVTAHRRMSIDLWNRVIVPGSSSASQRASLIAALKEQTASVLNPEISYQLELAAVLAVLDRDESQWETMKESISSLVQGSSQSQAVGWIDRLTQTQDRGLSDFLAAELIARCGIQPQSQDRLNIMKFLEKYRTEVVQKPYSRVVEKSAECERAASRIETMVDSNPDITPQLIAETIYASNLTLAMISELANQQDQAVLDNLLADGLPRLSQFQPALGESISDRVTEIIPSPSERRMKDRAIERLTTAEADRLAARTSALESLADLAENFDDLEYADALLLADYFLTEKELQEWLVVERVLPQLSNWPSLHLAFADLIRESKGQVDRVLTLHRLLTQGQIQVNEDEQWRDAVVISLVQFALGILQSRDYLGVDEPGMDWHRLQSYQPLAMATRTRILAQMLVPKTWGDRSYQEVLSLIIKQRANLKRQPWFENALIMVSEAPQLTQWVVSNQLLIELLAMDLEEPGDSYTARRDQVLGEYRQNMKKDLSLGQRLFLTEYVLLRLASIVRQQKTDELLER